VVTDDEFRSTLGSFATGVTIVTTFDDSAQPTGLTANAFSSVSLAPPLVLVCVHPASRAYAALRDGGRFAVSILGAGQQELARRFAGGRADRFDGVPYRNGDKLDVPLIDGALAHIECTTAQTHAAGDHVIFVGHVERVHAGGGAPLLYFRGRYDRLQDAGATPPPPRPSAGARE
jgi:flavin reductase (DIM6/NTAB) family NADH-FMN oxidoreductase RutF